MALIGKEFCGPRWPICKAGGIRQGASTITMQVSRDMFLTPQRDMKRKMSEIYISLLMEAEFTKEEIFSLYVNKIFLGQRAYGVGAAAEVYFGKTPGSIEPGRNGHPGRHPDRPLDGQSGRQRGGRERAPRPCAGPHAGAALHHPGRVRPGQGDVPWNRRLHGASIEVDAPYVAEMVRNEMQAKYGDGIYTAGYKVYHDPRFAPAGRRAPWRCAPGCWNTTAAMAAAAPPPRSICPR